MFTIKSASNPIYANEEKTAINLIVKFEEFATELPFTATSYDTESHGVDLYNRAKTGEFGEIAPYVAIENKLQPTTQGTQQA